VNRLVEWKFIMKSIIIIVSKRKSEDADASPKKKQKSDDTSELRNVVINSDVVNQMCDFIEDSKYYYEFHDNVHR
jgi:hypothetical protein